MIAVLWILAGLLGIAASIEADMARVTWSLDRMSSLFMAAESLVYGSLAIYLAWNL